MVKYIAPLLTVLVLLVYAPPAQAISMCVYPDASGNQTCNLYEADGSNVVTDPTTSAGVDPLWLVGYVFLVDGPTFDHTNPLAVAVISEHYIRLVWQAAGAAFTSYYNDAVGGVAIDGIDPGDGQIAGDAGQGPQGGAREYDFTTNRVGLVEFGFDPLHPAAWLIPDVMYLGGQGDSIIINPDVVGPVIPEPATMTLVGTGALLEAFRRRRNRKRNRV
jgi:hypothetical protein